MDVQPPKYIPVGEFIISLESQRIRVTSAQLARWRREGLMSAVEQRALGRGKGSVSCVRDDETDRAAAISRLLKQSRNFDDVRWRLWINDYAIGSEHLRSQLLAAAAAFDFVISIFKRILDDDSEQQDTAEQIFLAQISIRFFRQLRKRVGRSRFESFFFEIMQIGTSQFDDISIQP